MQYPIAYKVSFMVVPSVRTWGLGTLFYLFALKQENTNELYIRH